MGWKRGTGELAQCISPPDISRWKLLFGATSAFLPCRWPLHRGSLIFWQGSCVGWSWQKWRTIIWLFIWRGRLSLSPLQSFCIFYARSRQAGRQEADWGNDFCLYHFCPHHCKTNETHISPFPSEWTLEKDSDNAHRSHFFTFLKLQGFFYGFSLYPENMPILLIRTTTRRISAPRTAQHIYSPSMIPWTQFSSSLPIHYTELGWRELLPQRWGWPLYINLPQSSVPISYVEPHFRNSKKHSPW